MRIQTLATVSFHTAISSTSKPAASKPAFGRKLTSDEWPRYRETVDAALKVLGKKNLGVIIFEPSFPAMREENTGTGNILSKGGQTFVRFLNDLGFNHIQVGPPGLTPGIGPSPYIGTA